MQRCCATSETDAAICTDDLSLMPCVQSTHSVTHSAVQPIGLAGEAFEEEFGPYKGTKEVPAGLEHLFEIGGQGMAAAYEYLKKHPELYKVKKGKRAKEGEEAGQDQGDEGEPAEEGQEDAADGTKVRRQVLAS